MLKIMKYLKPYVVLLLLCTALLFVQANMELALPDLMSRIVTVGIQQSGIEKPVPEAIRESSMTVLARLNTPNVQNKIDKSYILITKSSSDYREMMKKYPVLENEYIYILSDITEEEFTSLEKSLQESLAIIGVMQQVKEKPEILEKMSGGMEFSMSPDAVDPAQIEKFSTMIPEGVDLSQMDPEKIQEITLKNTEAITMISMMTPEQIAVIRTVLTQMDDSIGPSAITQSAVMGVKAEYMAIGIDLGHLQSSYLWSIGGMMIFYTLIAAIATILVGLMAARIAAGQAQHIRSDIFRKVENFSGEEFDKFSTASLITRTTNDVTQVQMVMFLMIRLVIYAPILGIGGVIRAMGKAPSMAWIIGLALIILVMIISIVFILAVPKFKMRQKLIDRINLVAKEGLHGRMVVRAFNRQKFEEKRFDKANKDITKVNLFVIRVMVILMPIMILIMNVLSVVIIWVGAKQIQSSGMNVGDMMAFMQYSMQIVMAFLMLTMLFIFLPSAAVSANRIKEVLNTKPSILDPEYPEPLPEKVHGNIEFKNVCFRYPGADEDALHGLTFTAEAGKTTAIIGSTGAGKSTAINLIPRFYDVSAGEILLDGENIRNFTQHDLRSQIAYVPQKTVLFSGTIESNMRYADENATDEALRSAAETAQAMKFIEDKPEKMKAHVAQEGSNLSGGQKQRLSIARALAKKFPVMILDDCFSALDFQTDAALRKQLKEKTGDSAIIIIAQRVSTIMTAEQIIVLDEGKIVGKGTHKELLKSCEQYKEIALSQLDMKELS